jgi:hypothetical protein
MSQSPMSRTIRVPHASKTLRAIAAGLVALALFSTAFASDNDDAGGQSLANRRVGHYEDTAGSVLQLLGNAATKFGIPIGIELNGQLPAQTMSIEVSDGTVADAFSAIMKHAPGYTWVEKNGVVDIMPEQDTNSILDLRIGHFKVHNATPNDIQSAVRSLPEVKAWLSQNYVVERSFMTTSILIGSDGKTDEPRVSLERRNVTLREIMNSLVVKKGGPGSWSFARYGDSNKYLDISID